MEIIILILAVVLVHTGIPAYRKCQSIYQAHLRKKNVQKFEQSLVGLQSTLKDAIQICRNSQAPPKP